MRAAFGSHDEVDLVRIIWASEAYLADLDLVAVLGDQLVGHVLHSVATVDGRQDVGRINRRNTTWDAAKTAATRKSAL